MNTFLRRNVAALLSLLACSVLHTGALAQQATSAATQEVHRLDKFTVTGSHIPTTETALTAGASPVIRLDSQVIQESGMTTVSELLQNISPSNGGSIPISNNATGFTPAATAISLRGLGAEATLVLINGRRVATYPVGNGGTGAFVDLNSIALAQIDSIEVLKDGASAIYGADAVAGVVNIKMRKSLDGTEATVRYGNTTNKDSSELLASLITGAQSERAQVMVGVNYYKRNAIFNRDRDYSAVPPFLSSNASPLNLQITPEAAAEAGLVLTPDLAALPTVYVASPAETSNQGMTPASGYRVGAGRPSTFNFNEFSMSYPSRKNRGIFATAERKIFATENVFAYLDVNYNQAKTENQLAPAASGNFSTPGQIELVIPSRTTTPLALPGRDERAAPAGAFNPFNPFNVDITGGSRARLAEFGNRIFRNTTDALMITPGIRAENIGGKWNFDGFYSFSEVRDTSRNTLVSASRVNRLMNAADPFFDPQSDQFLGTTTPYNPFGYYRVSIPNNELVVGAALVDTKDLNISRLNQFSGVVSTSDLLPLPAGPMGFAFGADWRQERMEQNPDPFGLTGDLIGSSTNAITRGQRKVVGTFMEIEAPLVRHSPGAHDLSLGAAVRHERWVTSKQHTTVPKFTMRWQPIDETLTLRASWSKGFRQPSLFELYSSPSAGLTPIVDPRTGVNEPEQSVTVAGNRRLAPEKTDYLNVGIVWSPETWGLKGLSVGVDFWNVNRKGTVTNNYQDTVDRYFGFDEDGTAVPGGLLPGESVLLDPSGAISQVNSVFFNIGQTKAQGFDYFLEYLLRTDRMGRFEFRTDWSMFTHLRQQSAFGGEWDELINQPTPEGTGSDNGYLRWSGRAQVTWSYGGFTALMVGRFRDGFWDIDLDGNDFFIDRTWIFDAQVSYNFHNKYAPWLSDTKLAIGARNLFDKDPPYAAGNGGNSTGYPGFLYSSEGQFVYVQLSRRF